MFEILWKYGASVVAITVALGVIAIILNIGGVRDWIGKK